MRKRGNLHRHLSLDAPATPLGQIQAAAFLDDSRGVPARPLRVYGRYGFVLLLSGSGHYRDARGLRHKVQPGDCIFIFPEFGHWYGPGPEEAWNEIFVAFDGPIFKFLQDGGVLSETRPIVHIEDVNEWLTKLQACFTEAKVTSLPQATAQVAQLASLLAEVAAQQQSHAEPYSPQSRWLPDMCAILEEDLSREIDKQRLAEASKTSYDMFRKRFHQLSGMSPAQYRMSRRMQAACAMLKQTTSSNQEIARSLGFCDDSHFCKNFKEKFHVTPRQYRKQLATVTDTE